MAWEPRLCNRNRYVELLTQDSLGASNGVPSSLSGTEPDWTGTKTVTLELTQDEFTKLFSALMTGADIAYPDEAHAVLWILWGALEYP